MEEFEGLTVSSRPSINRIGSYPNIRTALAQQLPMSYVDSTHGLQQLENEKRQVFKQIGAEGNIQPVGKGDYIMKKTLFRFFIAAVTVAGILPMTGLAQGYRCRRNDNVNRREYYQRERIRDGIRSGELTRGEASRLINEQRRIESYERRSRLDDGRLDWRERRRLDQMLDRSNRDIYREKHDRQDRDRYWRYR
jgi:hypothetical protein